MPSSTPALPIRPPVLQAAGAYPWVADNGDGTYCNPILFADYSDPDVVRVEGDFFLTSSSFNCTPGLPILQSRDLVNWRIVGHALKNLPHPRYRQVQPGCGVWAPAVRFHDGKYWIFFPMPDEGLFVTTAAHPAGPWSEPHLVEAGRGLIDPCPLWDEDGKAYLVHAYARSRAGIKDVLRLRPMSPDGSRLLGEGQVVFHDPKRHPTIEGPKFLKKDGWYYLLAPAGGVATGWQVALRSRDIYGPYEDRVVLEQGGTAINGPHQGALVDSPDGAWWFVHFQDAGVYGRITHLQPVRWQDGWPLIGEGSQDGRIGEPVMRFRKPGADGSLSSMTPQTSDEFDSARLGPQWQWQANHLDDWYSLTAREGWLRLFTQTMTENSLSKAPAVLLQKFPARTFTVETLLDFASAGNGAEAGLAVLGGSHAALAIRRSAQDNQFVWRANGGEKILGTASNPVRLRVRVADSGKCVFSYEKAAGFEQAAETFQAQKGEWIGAKVGLYCLGTPDAVARGHADFEYFRFGCP